MPQLSVRREDVHDFPLAPALHLPVVVGSADCEVPLNTHSNDEKDATRDTDPEEKVVCYSMRRRTTKKSTFLICGCFYSYNTF